MRSLRLITIHSLIALAVLAPATTSAQEPRSPYGNRPTEIVLDDTTVYAPPAVQVEELTLNSAPQATDLQGTFSAYNGSAELIGNITYQLELLSPLPPIEPNQIIMDAPDIYDRSVGTEVLTLPPNASKSVSFTYTPPAVPAGEYRLRVQLMTSEGRILGQHQLTTTLAGSNSSFTILRPGTINVPEFADLTIAPLSGPNITAGSSFGLRATAVNDGSEPVTVTPTLTVHKFAANQPVVDTIQGASITVAPSTSESFEVPVTAASEAGVYHGVLSLTDANNQRSSTLTDYRWVVRGTGADILSARIAQLRTKQGEEVRVRVDYTGPTDAETVTKGKLKIEVVDQQGTAGEFIVPEELELNDTVVEGFAAVPLARDLIGSPGLRVTLTDLAGTVLDTYAVDLPLSNEEMTQLTGSTATGSPLSKFTIVLFVIGSLLAIVIIFYLLKQLKKPNFSPPTALLLLLACVATLGIGFYGVSATAQNQPILVVDSTLTSQSILCQTYAGWCALPGKIIQVTMYQPAHSNQRIIPYDRTNVPFGFGVAFAGCQNATDTVIFTLRYDAAGGRHSTLDGTNANWINLITQARLPGNCQTQLCVNTSQYYTPLNLGSLARSANFTTLQLQALSTRYDSVSQQFANPLLQGFGQVINTWVALHPLPPIEAAKQCSDGIDNEDPEDLLVDRNDKGCWTNPNDPTTYNPQDDSEIDPTTTGKPECSDGIDNSDPEDSVADAADKGCWTDPNNSTTYNPSDPSEIDPVGPVDPVITQCNDEIDNDNDGGRIDCADPGCWTDRRNPNSCDQTRNDESDPQCSDNRDNDGDGVQDSADPGCHTDAIATNPTSYNPNHTSEVNTQCSDTIDNDGDSKHNCEDPGCRTQPGNAASCRPADNNEQDPPFDPGDIVETD